VARRHIFQQGSPGGEFICAPPDHSPRATSKLDLGCIIYHMHMFPRALPAPKKLTDNVASDAGLF
jgi:hypothetical protein